MAAPRQKESGPKPSSRSQAAGRESSKDIRNPNSHGRKELRQSQTTMREAFKSEKTSARGKTKTGVSGRASMDTAEKEQDHQAQLDQVQVTMPSVRERNRGQYRSVNLEQQ